MNIIQRAAYFRGASDIARLQIIDLLLEHKEMSVTQLTEKLTLPQPTVSKHLAAMRTSEVVAVRRHGTQRLYRLHAHNAEEIGAYTGGLLRQVQKNNENTRSTLL